MWFKRVKLIGDMPPRANLFTLPLALYLFGFGGALSTPRENDTVVDGSLVHQIKMKSSPDLLSAAASKMHNHDQRLFHDDFKDEGFKRLDSTKGHDGYKTFDTFHTKDGDGFGYERHTHFNQKKGGGKDRGYHGSSSFDGGDVAAGSISPKYSEWNFEDSDSPGNSYLYESNEGDVMSLSKLVEPDYEGRFFGSLNKRAKRKKDNVQPIATEYDYEYAEVEDADDAPVDFETDEGADSEYANVESDTYDYY